MMKMATLQSYWCAFGRRNIWSAQRIDKPPDIRYNLPSLIAERKA